MHPWRSNLLHRKLVGTPYHNAMVTPRELGIAVSQLSFKTEATVAVSTAVES
jgi:hypothetical protein